MVFVRKLSPRLFSSHGIFARLSSSGVSFGKKRGASNMSIQEPQTINATPQAGQHIHHLGEDYTTIKEGLAYILIPKSAAAVPQTSPKGQTQVQSVFYNPIQQFNRDISVLAIKAYGEEVLNERRQNNADSKRGKKRKRGVGVSELADKTRHDGLENFGDKVRKLDDDVHSTAITTHADDTEKFAQSEDLDGRSDMKRREDASLATERSTSNGTTQNQHSPPKFTILDALSATGLRALRYSQEIPFATSITANDLLATATETINLNVTHNKLSDKIVSTTGNAITHMYSRLDEGGKHCQRYNVIDLDPYGTAVPFLDAAVQAVRDGGMLCVTCTDAGVWASNGYPEKAYSLYGGLPAKGPHSHEAGLRLILHSIATTAARYGLAIEPLLSLSIDFYARVFVRIRKAPSDVKFLAGKTMMVYNCDTGCGSWTTQLLAKNKIAENKSGKGTFYKHVLAQGPTASELCVHCGAKTHLAGPMYAGPLHSNSFINKILADLPALSKDTYATTNRIEGMLNLALEENLPPPDLPQISGKATPLTNEKDSVATIDHYPFFFIPSAVAKIVHCVTPHENALRGALRHLGYRVTRSHTKAGSIKTDAPWSVIWEIMREWISQKAPIREGAVRPGTAGWTILRLGENRANKTVTSATEGGADTVVNGEAKIVFDEELGKEKDRKKLLRYQLNPRENWGPMNRARGPI